MSFNTKMTAIADEIRTLSNTTDSLGLDEMASHIGEANSEIDSQADLISQIQAAVDNLPEAGGGEPNLQTKTVTPNTSSQNITPDSGYDGLSKVTVNAIPSTYVKPSATKSATTYTPSTSNQTIAAGTYCSGVQTIKGDANLKAENIVSGVSIFGVAGTASSGGGSGGSGSVETVNITLINTNMDDDYYICGMWVDNGYISSYETDIYCNDSKMKTAVKNSYIPINSGILKSITGSYSQIGSIGTAKFYTLLGDCTITLI